MELRRRDGAIALKPSRQVFSRSAKMSMRDFMLSFVPDNNNKRQGARNSKEGSRRGSAGVAVGELAGASAPSSMVVFSV